MCNNSGDASRQLRHDQPVRGHVVRGADGRVASQTDHDLRNKIQLRDAQVAGRCLEMRIYGYNVPAEGRTIYTTDYFHVGTPDLPCICQATSGGPTADPEESRHDGRPG